MMKISEINYSVIFDALKAYYEVEEDDSVWEIFNQADDQIEEITNALKVLGERWRGIWTYQESSFSRGLLMKLLAQM
ncbi:hypothetical protein ACLIW6_000151 [Salmonella enterica subsp. enterica serovar Bredeney]